MLLLTAPKKSELEKLCRQTLIKRRVFADFILVSMTGLLPWQHRRHHSDIRPTHLNLTDEDLKSFSGAKVGPAEGQARKAMKKVMQTFVERRYISGHLFFNEDLSNWHLFYFDQRDVDVRANHWTHGSHVHLINYLWPEHSAQSIWDSFCSGGKIGGAFHVRFEGDPLSPDLSRPRSSS